MKKMIFIILIYFHFISVDASMDAMDLEQINKRLEKLEAIVVQEKPYLSVCAENPSTQSDRQYKTIIYDSIFHSSTNIENGGLDICTGVFTSGQSGTYSVSWNSFSDARGPGNSLVLRKNSQQVSETQGTWTHQSRSILIDLEKGDTIDLYYNDRNVYGIDKLTFCISLTHSYATKEVRVQKAPKLSVLPVSKNLTESTMVYYLNLSTDQAQTGNINYDVAKSVADSFRQNHRNNSQGCNDNQTPRQCEKKCNSYTKRQCDDGCSFDYETLGECKHMPYGYVNKPGEEKNINPCLFLAFQPVEYWNPKGIEVPTGTKEYSYDDDNNNDVGNQLQFDCNGRAITDELDLYTQLLLEAKNKTIEWYAQDAAEYFINRKQLFEEMDELGENLYKLVKVYDHLDQQRAGIDGIKMLEKFRNHSTEVGSNNDDPYFAKLKQHLKEFLDGNINIFTLGSVVRFMRNLNKLKKDQRDAVCEEMDTIKTNFAEYSKSMSNGVSVVRFCEEIFHFQTEKDTSKQAVCYDLENYIQQGSFFQTLDTMKLIEYIDTNDETNQDQDLIDDLKVYKTKVEGIFTHRVDPIIDKVYEDKQLLSQFGEYGHNVIKFYGVKQHLGYLKDKKENIKITFFPESQGIPKKYFPLNGDEETPYVAAKLHLEDKTWLVPGQEVLVQCRAWYEGADHNTENASGMVKIKIILQ